jgi:ribosome maturation protein SDO1
MSTIARLNQGKKHFEIIVDLDKALNFKKGDASASDFLEADRIFTDSKRGENASTSDLKEAFGTEDVKIVSEKIVKSGEVQVTQEHRDEEAEKRFKQVVDFLSTNAIDPQTGNPITPERIKSALGEAHVNIKKEKIESQIKDILDKLSQVIPIKIQTKKVKLTIPAIYSGQVYGLVNEYKEDEKWLDDGSSEVVVNIPSGIIMDFYDKLNSITHGSVLTEDIKEDGE